MALAIGAVLLLTAYQLEAGVADAVRRLANSGERDDRRYNARRLLAQLAANVDVDANGASFAGGPQRLTFTSWAPSGAAWLERRRLTLKVEDDRLIVSGLLQDGLVLADSVQSVSIDYLSDLGADSPWLRQWESAVRPPVALRLRLGTAAGADTLVLVIGERG